MNVKTAIFFVGSMFLSGCVTSSPDVLLSTAPVGAAQKNGQYPQIGRVPVGQTKHLTAAEKSGLKSELGTATQKADVQAAQDSETTYAKEVAALKKLAKDQQKKRLAEIESRTLQ